MSFLSQMIGYFGSPALKESMFKALANQECKLEKDKPLLESNGFKADLYIETDDVIYLVKTIEKFQLNPIGASFVEDLIQAKKQLVTQKYKRIIPVVVIGQNTQSRAFLEAVYRNHVLVLQGTVEECAFHLEYILQHQIAPTYQISPRSADSEVRFFTI
ncbi:hypothetical protein [Effusibacillus consociatus]|uniref:Uncharacterized protein n=1 Tax=Effusibacillus consociatus TaxID=1117041 RepID=A0ABV9Q748_9BACL